MKTRAITTCIVLIVLVTASVTHAGWQFSDEFEDDIIDSSNWVTGGEKRAYYGAPGGSWTWSHTETVFDGGDPDGYLQMSVAGPYTGNSYGAEAWIRTNHDYNDGGWHVANFKWKAEFYDGAVNPHCNQYYIQVTDGYIPPTANLHWAHDQAVWDSIPELAGTINLLWTYFPDTPVWTRGGWIHGPAGAAVPSQAIPQGSPETWSILIDPSGTAKLYGGPDATGSLLREEALDPSNPWYLRFMVVDATSSGFGAGEARLDLHSFSSFCVSASPTHKPRLSLPQEKEIHNKIRDLEKLLVAESAKPIDKQNFETILEQVKKIDVPKNSRWRATYQGLTDYTKGVIKLARRRAEVEKKGSRQKRRKISD